MLKTLMASITALVLGGVLIWSATEGLAVFTAEGARRAEVARSPRPVPAATLIDMQGHTITFPQAGGDAQLVEFIYTRCPTICAAMGENFARLGDQLAEAKSTTRLLSISFDLVHDDQDALQGYGEIHGADGMRWNIARPATASDLDVLLTTFGITVIPDGFNGFEHNAAIHHVNSSGKLAGIYPVEYNDEILRYVEFAQ